MPVAGRMVERETSWAAMLGEEPAGRAVRLSGSPVRRAVRVPLSPGRPGRDRTQRREGEARASVAPLRARIRELEAELWRTRHVLEQALEAGAGRQLAATVALIDAL
jgi:hypothetical protein